jgi:hypothetical protein
MALTMRIRVIGISDIGEVSVAISARCCEQFLISVDDSGSAAFLLSSSSLSEAACHHQQKQLRCGRIHQHTHLALSGKQQQLLCCSMNISTCTPALFPGSSIKSTAATTLARAISIHHR